MIWDKQQIWTEKNSEFVNKRVFFFNTPSNDFSVEDGERVHFEVSFEPIFTAVTTSEVAAVLSRELAAPAHLPLAALPETLHIEVNNKISFRS